MTQKNCTLHDDIKTRKAKEGAEGPETEVDWKVIAQFQLAHCRLTSKTMRIQRV